jgi:hypothetical protein
MPYPHLLAHGNLGGRLISMHRRWAQQPDATVPMDVVVPVKERPCPCTSIDQTAKPIRIAWAILQRFEGRLGERIVIGDVRPAVARPEGTR